MIIEGITNIDGIFFQNIEIVKGLVDNVIVYEKTQPGPVIPDYFCFENDEGTAYLNLRTKALNQTFRWSYDLETPTDEWEVFDTDTRIEIGWDGLSYDKCRVYIVGYIEGDCTSTDYTWFGLESVYGDQNLVVKGNIQALWDYNIQAGCLNNHLGFEVPLPEYCGYSLFQNLPIKNAEDLYLPATYLSQSCYRNMFYSCTRLIKSPKLLPATTLGVLMPDRMQGTAYYCYRSMFEYCTSLTTVPEIAALYLSTGCCYSMFSSCSSLVTGPSILPATILANDCYRSMFISCTSLTVAPELPATTLTEYCYYYMFRNDSNLNYIKCLATDISAANSTTNWVQNVAANGTFVKDTNMSSWNRGTRGIPNNWTVEDA